MRATGGQTADKQKSYQDYAGNLPLSYKRIAVSGVCISFYSQLRQMYSPLARAIFSSSLSILCRKQPMSCYIAWPDLSTLSYHFRCPSIPNP
jgi:hypothetical protein